MFGRRNPVARADVGAERILEVIADAIAARGDGGPPMTPWELPIVNACRQVIADTVGQLGLVGMRDGTPRPTQPTVLQRPDPDEPRWLTMQRLTNSLTRHGRVFIMPTARDAAGYPLAVRIIDGDSAVPIFEPITGRIERIIWNGVDHRPGVDGIVWIPLHVDAATDPGTAPLRRCWRAAEYLAALWDMAGSFWEAGYPSIAVQVAHRLTPEQSAALKTQIVGAWSRRHEPAVIDNDGKLAALGSNAVDAQLVESIAVANAEIARAHGVMPSMVNVAAGDSLTYATTEAEFTKWLSVGLGPYLTRIEAGFGDLLPHGTTTRFDTAELTRADLATRANAYAVALNYAPWITTDEVRAREGLAPMDTAETPDPANLTADPLTVTGA